MKTTSLFSVFLLLATFWLASCATTHDDSMTAYLVIKNDCPRSVKDMGAGAIIDMRDPFCTVHIAPPGKYFSEKDVLLSSSTAGSMQTIPIETLYAWAEKDRQNAIRLKDYDVVYQVIYNDGKVEYYRTHPIKNLLK